MGFWIYMLIVYLLIPATMIASIVPTEIALHRNLDVNGKRRPKQK